MHMYGIWSAPFSCLPLQHTLCVDPCTAISVFGTDLQPWPCSLHIVNALWKCCQSSCKHLLFINSCHTHTHMQTHAFPHHCSPPTHTQTHTHTDTHTQTHLYLAAHAVPPLPLAHAAAYAPHYEQQWSTRHDGCVHHAYHLLPVRMHTRRHVFKLHGRLQGDQDAVRGARHPQPLVHCNGPSMCMRASHPSWAQSQTNA